MGFVYKILLVFALIIGGFILSLLSYFLIKTFIICVKNPVKTKHGFKYKYKHKLYHIREARYVKYVDFVKLSFI